MEGGTRGAPTAALPAGRTTVARGADSVHVPFGTDHLPASIACGATTRECHCDRVVGRCPRCGPEGKPRLLTAWGTPTRSAWGTPIRLPLGAPPDPPGATTEDRSDVGGSWSGGPTLGGSSAIGGPLGPTTTPFPLARRRPPKGIRIARWWSGRRATASNRATVTRSDAEKWAGPVHRTGASSSPCRQQPAQPRVPVALQWD
jgi:hypothetical protein